MGYSTKPAYGLLEAGRPWATRPSQPMVCACLRQTMGPWRVRSACARANVHSPGTDRSDLFPSHSRAAGASLVRRVRLSVPPTEVGLSAPASVRECMCVREDGARPRPPGTSARLRRTSPKYTPTCPRSCPPPPPTPPPLPPSISLYPAHAAPPPPPPRVSALRSEAAERDAADAVGRFSKTPLSSRL